MTAAAGTAARPGVPASVGCASCARALGSTVAFCPFCGTAQRVAAAPPPSPAPPAAAPPAASAVAMPVQDAAAVPPGVKPVPQPWAPSPVPPPEPVSPELVPPEPAPRKAGLPWRRAVLVAVALFVGAAVLRGNVAPAKATLVVWVHAAGRSNILTGRILVNGREAGAPGQVLTVAPGELRVGFEEPGWRPEAQTVAVGKDANVTVNLFTQELPGHLLLTSNPSGAAIRILGRMYGQSPLDVNLNAGTYEVSVALPGYATKILPVTLAHGETRTVSVDLAGVSAPAAPAPRFLPSPFDRGVVTAATPLQAAPAPNAETLATLPAASEVQVLGQVVADETWLQVRANGRQGFVRGTGAVEPWDAWAQRNAAAGAVDFVTSNLRVVVASNAYPLSGVQMPDRGFSGAGLARVTARLDEMMKGVQVRCVPRDAASFQCKTQEGRDVAELYVLNGAAVVGNGAPAYYADAQRTAREKQRGLWSE